MSIKVDREERPDLDDIYMSAVTALTGSGGWPLSVWLTPDRVPFYGGSYFPPSPRFGRPSFEQVLVTIAEMWKTRRNEIVDAAATLKNLLTRDSENGHSGQSPEQRLSLALAGLLRAFDRINGGWGAAPKFPPPLALEFLLARQALNHDPEAEHEIRLTLDAMAAGGIYDHIGGGFHRYATDAIWLVPHFEKMLYDNAQLARCYLHGWQVFGEDRYRRVARETLDYLLTRMRHARGGFFSAEDADSDGKEGVFYTWTSAEIEAVLPAAEAELVSRTYGVSKRGNFEGSNILRLAEGREGPWLVAGSRDDTLLQAAKEKLRLVRSARTHPARDEKVIANWNGLALAALADAGRAFEMDRYLDAATATAEFVSAELVQDGDRLAHSWKDGRAAGNGFLDDYACMVEGLLALYEATFAERWFVLARALTDALLRHFRRDAGGFYDTSDDHESLIVRPRSLQDSPTPSGNSMTVTVLLKMAAFTGESRYFELAEETLGSAPARIEGAPMMYGQWLLAMLLAEVGLTEGSVAGDLATPETKALLVPLRSTFRPDLVVAAGPAGRPSLVPLLEGRKPDAGTPAAAWVCRNQTCSVPINDPARLEELLATEKPKKT